MSIGSNAFTRVPESQRTLKVESYHIFLDVDLSKLRFDGKVKIRLESEADVKLDAVDLEVIQVKANGSPVKYQMSGEDLSVKTGKFSGTLDIDYRGTRSEEHTSELQSRFDLVCRLLLE